MIWSWFWEDILDPPFWREHTGSLFNHNLDMILSLQRHLGYHGNKYSLTAILSLWHEGRHLESIIFSCWPIKTLRMAAILDHVIRLANRIIHSGYHLGVRNLGAKGEMGGAKSGLSRPFTYYFHLLMKNGYGTTLYMRTMTNNLPHPKDKNWGKYIFSWG